MTDKRFYLESFEHDWYGTFNKIMDRELSEEVGSDCGEPEDKSLVRDFSWVLTALNSLSGEHKFCVASCGHYDETGYTAGEKVLILRRKVKELEATGAHTYNNIVCDRDKIGRTLDLLATIHCDGGHHTEKVGFEQSIHDAIKIVHELRERLE